MKKSTPCPVCASDRIQQFLRRSNVPVHQNLLMSDRESAQRIARGDLTMVVCHDCGFVFNSTFDESLLSYGQEYDNTQQCSPTFKLYMDGLVDYLVRERGVRNARIVEVGCGKGYFLRELVAYPGARNVGWGFDPSYVGPEQALDGRLRFERQFYGPDCASLPADVVVCRHVIEHVAHPGQLVSSIRQALSGSPQARVFFETPCVDWILRNHVIWDFFYEHCSLFTANSLATLFEASGFAVTEVRRVFEGQYLWLEASVSSEASDARRLAGDTPRMAQELGRQERALKAWWERRLAELRAEGPVAIWGAGAKGVTFANLVDPTGALLDCVVDLNPSKQAHYLPGTGHPIVDYRTLSARRVGTAILMNPNYRRENEALLRTEALDVRLIS